MVNYISKVNPDVLKFQLLTQYWTPAGSYDLRYACMGPRAFLHSWLSKYSPWLLYPAVLKGPVYHSYILFLQLVVRGLQGTFGTNVCTKYKDFSEATRKCSKSG